MRKLLLLAVLAILSGSLFANSEDEMNQSTNHVKKVNYSLITVTDTDTNVTEVYKVDHKRMTEDKIAKLSTSEVEALVNELAKDDKNLKTRIQLNNNDAADEVANYTTDGQWFVGGFVNVGVGFGPVGIVYRSTVFTCGGFWGPTVLVPPPVPYYPVPVAPIVPVFGPFPGPRPVPFIGPCPGPRPFPSPCPGPGPGPCPGPRVYGWHHR